MKRFSRDVRSGGLAGAAALGVATMLHPAAAHSAEQADAAKPAAAGESSTGLAEIVVTAQHRSENLQAVPISVTAITADAMARSGINGTIQLSQVVPAVQITRSGPSTIFFVRGVGNISGAVGEEGANAIYLDGVYLGDLASINLDFNNIERVEVLKGPQGTLFGRNSSGGLVSIITRDPGDTPVLKASVGYGNYDTFKGQFYAAGPIAHNLSADIALTERDQRKGWGTNLATGQDFMKGWYFGARSKIIWRPDSDTKITAIGDFRRSYDNTTTGFPIYKGSVGSGGYTYYGDYNVNSTSAPTARLRGWGASLQIEHRFDWATLTSLSATRFIRVNAGVDSDSTPLHLVDVDLQSQARTYQQEVRLASNSNEPLSWQGGLFYYHADANLFDQRVTGLGVGGIGRGFVLTDSMKTDSIAVFGDATYALTRTTHITGGVRFTHETRAFTGFEAPYNQPPGSPLIGPFTIPAGGGSINQSLNFNTPTYRVAIRQDLTDKINVYASYNRGFKSGLFGLNSTPNTPPVRPQTIDAFEGGVKSELFDNRLRLNLAGFHYYIQGYQVRAANPLGGNTSILLNATNVQVSGAEAEFEFAPTRELRFFGDAAYLHSRFGVFPNYPFTVPKPATCIPGANPAGITTGPPTGGNLQCFGPATGNVTPVSPTFAFTIGANYTMNFGNDRQLIANILYNHTSKVFFDTDNRTNQPGFGVLNGSLEYRPSPHWGVQVWADNLTDKHYYILVLESTTVDAGQLAAPRTFGVTIKYDF